MLKNVGIYFKCSDDNLPLCRMRSRQGARRKGGENGDNQGNEAG